MDFNLKENETETQYIWRLCSAKDSGELDLTWQELSDIFNKNLRTEDTKQGESSWRKQYQMAKRFFDEVFSIEKVGDNVLKEVAIKKHELQKEKYKLFDERRVLNQIARETARDEEVVDIFKRNIENGNLPKLEYEKIMCPENGKDMLVSLNDIHYGANINNYWNIYNSDICKERFQKYLQNIIDIQGRQCCENCIVWCNGDCISGNIHTPIALTNKENVIEQVMGVSELIAQFLTVLSKYFKTVSFVSVAGNHSRITKKEDSLTGERLDDVVEWWLKQRLQGIENIKFDNYDKIDDTMYTVNIRGLEYAGVHGDFDCGVAKLLALQSMIGKKIYAVLSGHLHHNKMETVQGIKGVMAGSFQGVDDFCVQKRIYGYPEQLICICDKNGIYCSYDIKL